MARFAPLLAESGIGDVFLPLVLTLAGVAALIGIVAAARKRMFGGPGGADDDGLSLGGLRDLVRQGKMSQEEYDRTKAQIVAAAQRKAERDAVEVKPDAPRRNRDDDDDADRVGPSA